jgi:hypothetical protein
LGITKYGWALTHAQWAEKDAASQQLFVTRLEGTDLDSLNIPPIRAAYILQYRNGLIGKHFKSLMQVSPFHLHGICEEKVFIAVKAIGKLGAVLWYSAIENMDEYLVSSIHYIRLAPLTRLGRPIYKSLLIMCSTLLPISTLKG